MFAMAWRVSAWVPHTGNWVCHLALTYQLLQAAYQVIV
jgi:hypothetical protein